MADAPTELRPMERCVLRMTAAGVPDAEIGRRLHRSAEHIRRVRALTIVPRTTTAPAPLGPHVLRPLERCVLRSLNNGLSHERISEAFRRGPGFAEFVEELARYKLSR
jgi:hypothetical protein